ncbi:sigma factor G inhibitor Gin [Paenibacillus harenae]|uniref:sigma factor G inhibitor Gin n=1 Tax=Paenibacillus harenae TaxID=306543 RepID=UPI0004246DAB|nr:sigma factor G inhibitor Gin [Paenibacillus harenae]
MEENHELQNHEHYNHCIICDQLKAEGQGIRIVSGFICETCEEEMVRTDVRDDKYPFFIHQMKQIFLEKNA